MKIHIARPKENEDRHPESRQLRITFDGKEYRSCWYITEAILSSQLKKSPGVPVYDSDSELAGHQVLTAHGEYVFRKYRAPKPTIQTMQGELAFHEEVTSIDTAQDILDGFRATGTAAACTHKYGLHQIYRKK